MIKDTFIISKGEIHDWNLGWPWYLGTCATTSFDLSEPIQLKLITKCGDSGLKGCGYAPAGVQIFMDDISKPGDYKL